MKRHRLTIVGSLTIALVALTAALAAWSPASVSSANAALAKPPKPPVDPANLMWAELPLQANRSWDGAMALADGWTEGGYDDWRVPTVEEFLVCLAAGTTGQWGEPGQGPGTAFHWSSDSTGRWVTVVQVILDAEGGADANLSGATKRDLKSGSRRTKFVRTITP